MKKLIPLFIIILISATFYGQTIKKISDLPPTNNTSGMYFIIDKDTNGAFKSRKISIDSIASYTLNGGALYWNKNNGSLFPTTLTDSVGIGTNDPDYLFDVVGKAMLTNGSLILDNTGTILGTTGHGFNFNNRYFVGNIENATDSSAILLHLVDGNKENRIEAGRDTNRIQVQENNFNVNSLIQTARNTTQSMRLYNGATFTSLIDTTQLFIYNNQFADSSIFKINAIDLNVDIFNNITVGDTIKVGLAADSNVIFKRDGSYFVFGRKMGTNNISYFRAEDEAASIFTNGSQIQLRGSNNDIIYTTDTSRFNSNVVIDSTFIAANVAEFRDSIFIKNISEASDFDSVPVFDGDTLKKAATVQLDSITGNIGNSVTGVDTVFLDVIHQSQYTGSLTDGTPTDAEIDAILGTPATAGAGFRATILDSDGTALLYRIETNGISWFYVVMTKAL